jgi:hypothetical protein
MDPVSALILAYVITAWLTAKSATQAAADQVRAEARTAASAIRDDLKGRGGAWAKGMGDRLDKGREGGPSTGLWWGWAALRTGQALRRALRKKPRGAEKTRAIRDTSGPFRRIWEAGQRGARFAYDETRHQREARERPTGTPVGVCERCGAVVARASLAQATDSTEQLCVMCRTGNSPAPTAEQEPQEEKPSAPDREGDRPAIEEPRPAAPAQPTLPVGPDPSPVPPTPALPQVDQAPATPTPSPDRAIVAPVNEGEPMAPRQPGQVVPVRNAPMAKTGGGSGEAYTHGQFNRAVADIEKRLAELPATLEAMLSNLTAADAGRAQVRGVLATHGEILAFMGQVRAMLTDVNRREAPVLNAVEAAGGPVEVPGFKYLSEV